MPPGLKLCAPAFKLYAMFDELELRAEVLFSSVVLVYERKQCWVSVSVNKVVR